jgi:hypothetical protein
MKENEPKVIGRPCKATHDDICDNALRHYVKLTNHYVKLTNNVHEWHSLIPKTIEFYRKYKVEIEGE